MKVWKCTFCTNISPSFGMTCGHCGHYGSLQQTDWEQPEIKRHIRCPKCSSQKYNSATKICPDCIPRKRRPNPEDIGFRKKK